MVAASGTQEPSFAWPTALRTRSPSARSQGAGGRSWHEPDARVARELRGAFDVLLNRAVRQRNAILHGRAFVPEVVASVEPFLGQLSGYLAYLAAKGIDMDKELEETRAGLVERFEKLASEQSGLALWPER
jgi:hypothetical protein